ncbi:hypothetical protein ACFUTV_14675 [Streptomyces sp. NPDC057298]|uniref:hypothetical protein n=1 Tax=Streptomyces sp. NPDC057298 TaxID=3346091 RepID=UPI00363B5072
MSENSHTQEMPEEQNEAVPDSSEAIRSEIHHEYAGKLARAAMETQAAKDGITLPEGYTGYLDTSKLVGEDGNPSAEAIAKALEPFQPDEPKFPPLSGAGWSRGSSPITPHGQRVSLDARHRK